MAEFPLTSIEQIIRAAGGKRVSRDAKEELAFLLESVGAEIAAAAAYIASKDNRKTVTAEDVRKAKGEIWG